MDIYLKVLYKEVSNQFTRGEVQVMARVTVEDCLEKVKGRFDLAVMGARRAKMIQDGSKPLLSTGNKSIVTALREIAAGKVFFEPRKDETKEISEEIVDATIEETKGSEETAPEASQNNA